MCSINLNVRDVSSNVIMCGSFSFVSLHATAEKRAAIFLFEGSTVALHTTQLDGAAELCGDTESSAAFTVKHKYILWRDILVRTSLFGVQLFITSTSLDN